MSRKYDKNKMIDFVISLIDREVEKPDGETNFALIEDCQNFLAYLMRDMDISEKDARRAWKNLMRKMEYPNGKPASMRTAWKVGITAAVVLVCTISLCAFNPSLQNMLCLMKNQPDGAEVAVGETEYINTNNIILYDNMKDLVNEQDLPIYYINALDTLFLTEVRYVENSEAESILVIFSDKNVGMRIKEAEQTDIESCQHYEKETINDITFYIVPQSENSAEFSIIFYDEGYVYYISANTADKVYEIINHLVKE